MSDTISETMNAEQQVLAVVKGVYESWNKADADTFVQDYFDDASAILPGNYLNSKEAIRQAMAFSFSGPLKGTRASDKVLDVRFVGDSTAIVISETGVLIPGEDSAPPERTVFATWVLAKDEAGAWKLAAYTNSPSVAPGP